MGKRVVTVLSGEAEQALAVLEGRAARGVSRTRIVAQAIVHEARGLERDDGELGRKLREAIDQVLGPADGASAPGPQPVDGEAERTDAVMPVVGTMIFHVDEDTTGNLLAMAARLSEKRGDTVSWGETIRAVLHSYANRTGLE